MARRAEEVGGLLRALEDDLATSPLRRRVETRLPAVRQRLAALVGDTAPALGAAVPPNPRELDALESRWRALRAELEALGTPLTRRAVELEQSVERLSALRQHWLASREAAAAAEAPAALLARAKDTVSALERGRRHVRDQRARILELQDRVTHLAARCDDTITRIVRLRPRAVVRLLQRERPAWSREHGVRAWHVVPGRLGDATWARARAVVTAVTLHAPRLQLQLLLFVVLAVALVVARRRLPARATEEPPRTRVAALLSLPFSLATALAALASLWLYPHEGRLLQLVSAMVAVVPVVRLLRRLVLPTLYPAVHALAAFFVASRLRLFLAVPPPAADALLLVEVLLGLALLTLLSRSRPAVPGTTPRPDARPARLVRAFVRALGAVFVFALVAAAAGYLALAEFVETGAVASAWAALGLHAGVRAAEGLLALAVRTPPLTLLRMVRRHRERLEQRGGQVLRWGAGAAWGAITLRGFALLEPTATATRAVLSATFTRGAVSVSIGDVLVFGLTVWLAFALSAFARFVLAEDVFPRLRLARGVPYAVSSLLHYTVLTLGFLFAVAAMGFDLDRITILAGAFGVGIGFGLQAVVNNFVSGLILLFERPVQVGDTVELGTVIGEIRRIGIRSSTIRTWDGAEVILPNASLISDAVTNWTLSDRMRRIELPVGVAYGSDPDQVLELLRMVARQHPLVVKEPAPVALFNGFGDSALDFSLRAWTDRFEQWMTIRSELAVGVHAALREAGIPIPFPQRDVHLDPQRPLDVRVIETPGTGGTAPRPAP
jgi:small-conductance mechanosensitive channel